jgi:REP-associated tyrosine transposase
MSHKNQSVSELGCYYLTFNVTDWTDIFVKPVFKQIIAESLNYFVAKKGLIVYGWCLMTNHLHLIATASKDFNLTPLANEYKEFTSKIILADIDAESKVRRNWIMKNFADRGNLLRLTEKFQVWQANINPIYIDSENLDILNEHLDYIHSHPVRERIVSKPEDYIYSSARDYAGLKGLVNITMVKEKKESNFILRRVSSY